LLAVLAILLLVIVKAFYANKSKSKKIALQSLRREMNPHFIFNSLNSVNRFIAENNELEANKYLTSYSRLMRNVMENSGKDFIKLSTELEQLNEYLQLEQLRFGDKFSYNIHVDESIDTESFFIPNMLIQPHLENAVWHGLRYKSEKGLLRLNVELKNGHIVVTVDDNGIGLSRSREMKTENQKIHVSRGLTNIKERIRLLNDLYKMNITMDITEKNAPDSGVTVTLSF
jgi:LytS/YehU family sensor histidine kinase